MFFCLSQRYHVRPFRAFGVDHHNHICVKKTEANQALFAIVLPFILAGHSEVIPDNIASNEVKPVILDVQLALRFIPAKQVLLYLQIT
jgi:hypothetical protein